LLLLQYDIAFQKHIGCEKTNTKDPSNATELGDSNDPKKNSNHSNFYRQSSPLLQIRPVTLVEDEKKKHALDREKDSTKGMTESGEVLSKGNSAKWYSL
jgi:hypothetical protein